MATDAPAHAMPEPSTAVMIVEDDRALRSTLAATLTMAGFEVVQAGTGEEALALGSVQAPDLYLLDLSLPGIGSGR
jgi:DNA-binding response OmpR family regulator